MKGRFHFSASKSLVNRQTGVLLRGIPESLYLLINSEGLCRGGTSAPALVLSLLYSPAAAP